jgi:hypothetical protein
MVREARLLWDNPALRPDDADRLRRLEEGRDSSSRKPRRRGRPKPAGAEKPTLDARRPATKSRTAASTRKKKPS